MHQNVIDLYNKMKVEGDTNIQINQVKISIVNPEISTFPTPLSTNPLPATVQQHLGILATAYSQSIGLNPSDSYVVMYRRPLNYNA